MSRNRKQKGVSVNGILLLDKPAGCSSNQALQKAKHLFNARKAGHTGSLDPIATGLLPICFGETTKISGLFLHADKTYQVGVRLGVTTETGDCEGKIIERKSVDLSSEQIEDALHKYRGSFEQTPPMYSALKKNGQPLYKLARQGIVVEREPRLVTVYKLSLDNWDGSLVQLTVSCSKGFYVRTLAEDIGKDLGCGGHVETLRRTVVGKFELDQAVTLEQLEAIASPGDRKKQLLPTDQGLSHLPEVRLPDNLARYIQLGQSIRSTSQTVPGLVRLYSETAGFLGLGEITADRKLAPKRLFGA